MSLAHDHIHILRGADEIRIDAGHPRHHRHATTHVEGDAFRVARLGEPSRSIMNRCHPVVPSLCTRQALPDRWIESHRC
jgi:hypothetical protein